MRRWFVGTTLVITVVVAGLYGYATTLPIDHRAQVQVTLNTTPAAARARVEDWRETASWKPGVESITDLGVVDGHRRYRECTWECVDVEIDSTGPHFVSRIVDHPDFGGTWTWEFREADTGTLLVLTEDGHVPSPLFRLFMHHVFGADANIRATSEALKTSFEG